MPSEKRLFSRFPLRPPTTPLPNISGTRPPNLSGLTPMYIWPCVCLRFFPTQKVFVTLEIEPNHSTGYPFHNLFDCSQRSLIIMWPWVRLDVEYKYRDYD